MGWGWGGEGGGSAGEQPVAEPGDEQELDSEEPRTFSMVGALEQGWEARGGEAGRADPWGTGL